MLIRISMLHVVLACIDFSERNIPCYNAETAVISPERFLNACVMNAPVMNYVAGSISDLETVAFPRECVINFVADLITIAIAAITILIGYNGTISDYVVKRL